MKKVVFSIILCLKLFSSEIVVASEQPALTSQKSSWMDLFNKVLDTLGMNYIYDFLQKYLPETRATKTARMKEALLEARYRQIYPESEEELQKKMIYKNDANLNFVFQEKNLNIQ